MVSLALSHRVMGMKPSATLGMAQAARALAEAGVDVVILSTGEPDFITPKAICEVGKESIDAGKTHYAPVAGTKTMISAMQEKFLRDQKVSYGPDEVMCTVGAKSALMMALMTVINEGDEVIVFAPYWLTYIEQIRLCGGIPVVVECKKEDNFMPTKQALERHISPKTKAMILNSPNCPTSAVISEEQLRDLASMLTATDIWVLCDEIYEKLLFDDRVHVSLASLSDDMRNRSIVISGASKGYAMTGWRVGVVAGNKSIIAGMVKLQGQEVTCLPEFIQAAAAFALKENDEVKEALKGMQDAYSKRRSLALSLVKQWPYVEVFMPQGAFYLWVNFSHYVGKPLASVVVKDDIDLATRMLKEAHVACAPGTPFGGEGFLRFSIASSEEAIKKAFKRIEDWLSKS